MVTAGYFEIGRGQPIEGVVRHAIAAHEFRLRICAERDHARRHGEDGCDHDPADGVALLHRDTLRTMSDRTVPPSAMNAAACSQRSSRTAASRISPLAEVANVGSP